MVGFKEVVQLPGGLVLGVLSDGLGDQGEQLNLIALAVTAGAAIGEIGVNRLAPRRVCFLSMAGGPLQYLQQSPRVPWLDCVAVWLLAFDRPLKFRPRLLVASE